MLEYSAPTMFCQEPEFWNQFRSEMIEAFVTSPFAQPLDNSVKITFLFVSETHFDRHILADKSFELDSIFKFGEKIELKAEKLRNRFVTVKSDQKQNIF